MIDRSPVLLRLAAMTLALVCCAGTAFAAGGPPKPGSSPKKCSVSAVGAEAGGAAAVGLLALGVVVAASRRRARD